LIQKQVKIYKKYSTNQTNSFQKIGEGVKSAGTAVIQKGQSALSERRTVVFSIEKNWGLQYGHLLKRKFARAAVAISNFVTIRRFIVQGSRYLIMYSWWSIFRT